MNDTRKIMGKIRAQRDDLEKKDGKTKDRVETWRKNIHSLTNDMKKQVDILDQIDGGENTTEGGGDMRRDYFSMLVSKLNKDIDDLMKICQKVTTLNMGKITSSEQNETNWTIMRQTIRSQCALVFQQKQDKSKLLFLRLKFSKYSCRLMWVDW